MNERSAIVRRGMGRDRQCQGKAGGKRGEGPPA
jgi:hypothetical protein